MMRPEDGSGPEEEMFARNPPGMTEALSGATAGIAGLGGLGSNIAAMLARSGIGRIVAADFDRVEPSNLNRQNYGIDDLGLLKTEATERALRRIRPGIAFEGHAVRLGPDNIPEIMRGCDVVIEALDGPEDKAMLVSAVLEKMPGTPVICGNGMSGFGDADRIVRRHLGKLVTVCGDMRDGGVSPPRVAAPKVTACAALMADAAVDAIVSKYRASDSRREKEGF